MHRWRARTDGCRLATGLPLAGRSTPELRTGAGAGDADRRAQQTSAVKDTADLQTLLARNRQWASALTQDDPQFFTRLAHQQAPRFLWIGCSDSRVPANQILGLMPGEIFVHRNVANVVVHSDLNCLSVVQYAVEVLKVRDIIICGHYGCGGVAAAFSDQKLGLIDNWLRHVQDVGRRYADVLAAAGPRELQLSRLCELNVLA